MAVKKSELYRSLWAQCDALRGGMDASQYKDYVLVLLFMKYVSDKYAGRKDGLIEIPKGCSYADIVALAGKSNIGEEIDKKIAEVAKANDLEGVINLASFNDDEKLGKGKELVDRVSDLVKEFDKAELNFKHNRAEDDDLLGDAYEYLMRHFATESGKSKGQFYTPAEVSRIMAQIIGLENVKKSTQSVYDLACGSGSLLMKAYDYAKQNTGVEMSVYGQEMDNATYGLARMNCVLHDNPTAEIAKGNTLADPQFKDRPDQVKRFDFAVANPPFSWKKWTQGLTGDDGKGVVDQFKRFDGYAVPPPKNGDYAFLLHMLASLKSTGTGCIVMPHGVLFRGNKEETIRTELIRKGYIKGIIGLPANLFYGTGIPACLIVIDKKDADSRKAIFMIDASRGFRKDGPKNRLREQDLHRIVDVFNSQDESDPKYARLVPLKEIEEHGYNLNIPRYIDSSEPEDLQDIEAHLLGGIPNRDIDALQEYWDVFPSLRKTLFKKGDRKGYSELKVEPEVIRETIFGHEEFTSYAAQIDEAFAKWSASVRPSLEGIDKNTSPRKLITELGESILEAYEGQPLINAYRVYQHLMDYWTETMKDDVYLVIENGWDAAPRELVKEKGKSWPDGAIVIKDGKKQRAYLSELLPKQIIIDCYLSTDSDAITALEAERDAVTTEREALQEEHGGDDGLLQEVINDKGNITKGDLGKRIKELKSSEDEDDQAELKVLLKYQALSDKESQFASEITERSANIEKSVLAKSTKLKGPEAMEAVLSSKWESQIGKRISEERDRTVTELLNRLQTIAERYESALSKILDDVQRYSVATDSHLAAITK
ncbi:type I restriction-modification system subunit M [Rhodopirellula sp. JC740]|uniref:site-specific DNA-methyltransferase (adenine-specific) n=1 Tax=Rhodopirellula halodulae TaxID=2894198 RepID=A0ABS8NFG8_9BACT|nr:type I restriction-modification system subunit M [Rhodopirellula sp. JC740]MCC9641677.1 type I restriction-modification system subunit M [Rhodopirellula sp. JC740]